MTYTVVCISRDVGAGGEEIGRALADRLGFRFVDEEIVQRAAAQSGVDPETVASIEERRSLAGRLLDAMEQAAIAMPEAMAWAPDAVLQAMPKEGLRELIKEAVRQTADEGRAVIVAHAASYVLSGREGVLRILVTGTPDVCARRLAERAGMSEDDARKQVAEGRNARIDYLRRFHEVRDELPTHYDLVVNTDQLSMEDAVSAVLSVAQRHSAVSGSA